MVTVLKNEVISWQAVVMFSTGSTAAERLMQCVSQTGSRAAAENAWPARAWTLMSLKSFLTQEDAPRICRTVHQFEHKNDIMWIWLSHIGSFCSLITVFNYLYFREYCHFFFSRNLQHLIQLLQLLSV